MEPTERAIKQIVSITWRKSLKGPWASLKVRPEGLFDCEWMTCRLTISIHSMDDIRPIVLTAISRLHTIT